MRKLATPADVLQVSRSFAFAMNVTRRLADTFGFWDRPSKNAATLYEEMTALDKFYWIYKCRRPITLGEEGEQTVRSLTTDASIVSLPEGFKCSSSITLGAGGDLFQTEGIAQDVIFERVADLLFDRTISYASLESAITEKDVKNDIISDKESPTDSCSKEAFDILKAHKGKRFTAIHTASNHMADLGIDGLDKTQTTLEDEGIVDIGTNRTRSDYGRAKTVTKNGIKVGFASATFGLNGRNLPPEESYRINVANILSKHRPPELGLLKQQIDDCKEKGCDFIIASIHGGYEFEMLPRRREIDMAHELIEYGADTIISHHPHVIQPVEYYRTKRDPDRVAVIAHSLGSMVWAFSAPHIALSLILNLKLTKGSSKGHTRTYIERASATPIFRNTIEKDGQILLRLEKLSDHLDGKSDCDPAYVGELKRYAGLVLGT